MKMQDYKAISLTTINEEYLELGGSQEDFEVFINDELESAYTWGDAAHTLVSLEGFLGHINVDESVTWCELHDSLADLLNAGEPVYVDLET